MSLFLLQAFLASLTHYFIFYNICKKKFELKTIIFIISTITVSIILTYNFVSNFELAGLLSNVASVIALTLVANAKMKILPLSLVYSIFSITILLWSGTLSSVILDIISLLFPAVGRLHAYEVTASWFWGLLYLAVTFVMGLGISHVVGHYLRKRISKFESALQKKLASYLLFSALVTLGLFFTNVFLSGILTNMGMYALVYALILTVSFISLTFAVFAFTDSLQKQAEAELKKKSEKDLAGHTRQIEQAYNNMRSFRHDYRNLLSTLMGYDNMDELKGHLKKTLGYAEKALENLDSVEGRLNLINIPELKGVLWVKCAQAAAQGIDVELNIAEPVYDACLSREELCRIVGIIMDNAIDELHEHDYNPKVLKLSFVVDEGDLIIDCANPYKTQPLLRKIFDEGYSTKGPGRGLGLSNLMQICENNQNTTYTVRMVDGEFALVIVIRKER